MFEEYVQLQDFGLMVRMTYGTRYSFIKGKLFFFQVLPPKGVKVKYVFLYDLLLNIKMIRINIPHWRQKWGFADM